MWYVNAIHKTKFKTKFIKLCINYVVCEYLHTVKSNKKITSYVLTIWYVNNKYINKYLRSYHRYVLTIWYVNMFIQQKLNKKITSYVLTIWYVNGIKANSRGHKI